MKKKKNKKEEKFLSKMKDTELYQEIGQFKNEYGEKYYIFTYLKKYYFIAGNETNWNKLFLIKTSDNEIVGVDDLFLFNENEIKKLNKILKDYGNKSKNTLSV